MNKKTLIMGVGNVLQGDEGFGAYCAQELAGMQAAGQTLWLDDIEIVDGGTRGLFLISFLKEASRVILIDVITGGLEPGTIYKIPLDKLKVKNDGPMISMHDQTITEVINIAKMTGVEPDVLVIGVEPKFIGTSLELTDELKAAMPKVIEEIKKELANTPAEKN